MGTAWRYWTHVRLEASGTLKRQEIEPAKAFFQQQFPDYVEAELPDLLIQRQLVKLMRFAAGADSSAEPSQLAECCLRCFVSQQIPQVCLNLERRFASQAQFTSHDLLPYVLDDMNPMQPCSIIDQSGVARDKGAKASHQPLAVKIVHTFDPEQSNLSTWTKRLVLQQKYLNAALTECGIYLASDWSILSHTSPGRLMRLLSGVLTEAEIQRACCLLNSFHAVYRADRTQRRSTNSGQRCSEPTPEQLERMVVHLTQQGIQGYTPTRVLRELRELAQKLRQGKKMAAMSLDDENTSFLADQQQARQAEADDDQDDFLSRYRHESEQCLVQAIQQAIDNRLAYLRTKKPPKDSQILPDDQAFLKALRLFYCEDKSMTEIAPLVGKQKQYQVTRLLKLDELRADVRMNWLFLMVDQLDLLLQDYLNSDQLQQLRQRLKQEVWADIRQKWLLMLRNQPDVLLKDYLNQGQFLLGELIDQILNQDTTSTYTRKPSPPKPNQQPDSSDFQTAQPLHVQPKHLYARCICQYLNLLET